MTRAHKTGSSRLQLHLESIRQARNISLEQISATTKISTRFLQAIESEEFDQLPGGIFNTNYLRQYAAEIGLDPGRLLDVYRRRTEPEPEVPVVPPKSTRWSFSW